MTHLQITSSIYYWLTENWDTDIHWWDPSRWDEAKDGLTTWATVQAQVLGEPPTRESGCRLADVRVIVRVYSRSKTDLHAAAREASEVGELLRHEKIPVTDGSMDYGLILMHEPNLTPDQDEDLEGHAWQVHRMVITGKAQQDV